MAAEGMLPDPEDVIVTTGGQQAIDLVCKTLVDPGDSVICEAPTYPGAVPVFCSYEAEVIQVEMRRRRDAGRRARGRARPARRRGPAAEVHLLGAELPEPGRGDAVAASGGGGWSSSRREHEVLVVEDNPYGLLRYEGEPLPPLYQLDGGDYVIYIGTFSKILSPGIRLGWAVAPPPVMEKIVLGKQASDLCTSTLTQYFVREYFAEGRWREYIDEPRRRSTAARRDVMLEALAEHFPAQATWTAARGRPLRLGDAARLHRHHRPAGEGAARERRLRPRPGRLRRRARRAARCASTSPASTEDEIREGVRRIGEVIAEQVALYETLTGEHPVPAAAPSRRPRRRTSAAAQRREGW